MKKGLIIGAIIGGAVALLSTPKKGSEVRQGIKKGYQKTKVKTQEVVSKVKENRAKKQEELTEETGLLKEPETVTETLEAENGTNQEVEVSVIKDEEVTTEETSENVQNKGK